MKLLYKTETRTDAGTWSGGQHVIVENQGGAVATVAGKVLAVNETIEFQAQQDDHIEFDYDAPAGGASTLEFTYGVRTNR